MAVYAEVSLYSRAPSFMRTSLAEVRMLHQSSIGSQVQRKLYEIPPEIRKLTNSDTFSYMSVHGVHNGEI